MATTMTDTLSWGRAGGAGFLFSSLRDAAADAAAAPPAGSYLQSRKVLVVGRGKTMLLIISCDGDCYSVAIVATEEKHV